MFLDPPKSPSPRLFKATYSDFAISFSRGLKTQLPAARWAIP